MRIGVDACCWSNRRGFGRFTRELLKALVAVDQENEYFFFVDEATASSADGFPAGADLVKVPTHVSPTRAASASGNRSVRDLMAMTRAVMGIDVDVFFFPAVYTYFPVLNRGVKVIVTLHDLVAELLPDLAFPNRMRALFWKLKERLAARRADLILTVSEFSRREILRHFGLPEPRVRSIREAPVQTFRVLPGGAEMARILERYRVEAGSRFILYVGGISPHKNLSALVDVFHRLAGKPAHSDVMLVLVGDIEQDSFHTDYSVVRDRVDRLGLGNKVIFTGFVEDRDLVFLYNAATVLVLPSFLEGFGLPAVEAMACGTPVAAAATGSLPEVVGGAGCLFDPYSRHEMQAALETLLSDEEKREEMGLLALKKAQEYSWESAARDTVAILEDLP